MIAWPVWIVVCALAGLLVWWVGIQSGWAIGSVTLAVIVCTELTGEEKL